MFRRTVLCGTALTLAAVSAAWAQVTMTRHTIDGGGGVMYSSDLSIEVQGTIGQPDAGPLTGGTLSLSGGFWFPVRPGDCDEDGGVSLFDQGFLALCVTGPGGGPVPIECLCFDVNRSGAVDLGDVAIIQSEHTGS